MTEPSLKPISQANVLSAQVIETGSIYRLNGELLIAVATRPVGNLSVEDMRSRVIERMQRLMRKSNKITLYTLLSHEVSDDGTSPVVKISGASAIEGVIAEGKYGITGILTDEHPTVLFAEPAPNVDADEPPHPFIA